MEERIVEMTRRFKKPECPECGENILSIQRQETITAHITDVDADGHVATEPASRRVLEQENLHIECVGCGFITSDEREVYPE